MYHASDPVHPTTMRRVEHTLKPLLPEKSAIRSSGYHHVLIREDDPAVIERTGMAGRTVAVVYSQAALTVEQRSKEAYEGNRYLRCLSTYSSGLNVESSSTKVRVYGGKTRVRRKRTGQPSSKYCFDRTTAEIEAYTGGFTSHDKPYIIVRSHKLDAEHFTCRRDNTRKRWQMRRDQRRRRAKRDKKHCQEEVVVVIKRQQTDKTWSSHKSPCLKSRGASDLRDEGTRVVQIRQSRPRAEDKETSRVPKNEHSETVASQDKSHSSNYQATVNVIGVITRLRVVDAIHDVAW
ncbi:hypothetical protein Hypma_009918 [Hypsizygus marmoreus]|uniref:Uncharacterized protein n=1 Tax=Hypsizygus marmoreus TaxID=39966 RepID=A0A369JRD9_HYPMA|nr:hypothetical protein Hypma_009918 [Hypsizygus marmoreus]